MLATTLQTMVRDAKNLHPLSVSRVVSYLLNLLRLSHVRYLENITSPIH
jgi:brefeldin A-resistance guanine nucleotide exchange factor 1